MAAFNTTAMTLGNKAEEECQLESIKDKGRTSLYTIVDGKLDKPLEIKGNLPREGYILVNDKCEIAYSFYDENNVVSKNFKEAKAIVNNKSTAPSYGLEWKSNISEHMDTYSRTLDSSTIDDDSVKVQVGDMPVSNAFDELDIYKDILPYTDEFGNKFMLIPKFYISKTKEKEDNIVTWNYAVSKHKLDDTYYLPANFVDEGIDNTQHIELPYVLVSKYEAGSNGASGNEEMLVSKSGIIPKVNMTINTARDLATRYNDIEGVNGYQLYDIHIHDLINILYAIEFKTMDTQYIMKGYTKDNEKIIKTGESNLIKSSSGTLSNEGHNSFHYRGMENLWGNVWKYVDGLLIDQSTEKPYYIYTSYNSRYYSEDNIEDYYIKLEGYHKLNAVGWIVEQGFDSKVPFVNLPIVAKEFLIIGLKDFYWQSDNDNYNIIRIGGSYARGCTEGLNFITSTNNFEKGANKSSRLVKSAIRN